jgi:hypothetical protein
VTNNVKQYVYENVTPLTVNTPHLNYKGQTVNSVLANNGRNCENQTKHIKTLIGEEKFLKTLRNMV